MLPATQHLDVVPDTTTWTVPGLAVPSPSNAVSAPAEQQSGWRMDLLLLPQQLKQPDALQPLLSALASMTLLRPHLPRIETVLQELYSNALDHGVLGLSSAIKVTTKGFLDYYQQQQWQLDHLSEGFVAISIRYATTGDFSGSAGAMVIEVRDSGAGFDYGQLLKSGLPASVQPQRTLHGRGLMLVCALSDDVRFSGCGNKVEAIIRWQTVH